jgi:hypothetical protein
MFERHLIPHLLKYAKQYPIVALVGPRQKRESSSIHLELSDGFFYFNILRAIQGSLSV